MKNLKNEGDSPLILQRDPRRITPKPLETRQIPLDSPCAKCGESSGKLGANQVNRIQNGDFGNRIPKPKPATTSEQLGLPLTNEGGEV